MDPQATWEELLRSWQNHERAAAKDAAQALKQWLTRGGFAPTVTKLVASDNELHRVIALAVIQHVLNA